VIKDKVKTGYFNTIFDALSQLINAVAFNSGNANESISGRCWRQREHWFFGRLLVVIDSVFWIDNGHCERAHWSDVSRASKTMRNARV
jgi:hypothetical protein